MDTKLVMMFVMLLTGVESRGGNRMSSQPTLEEKTYPSQVRRYYYNYYINYFTPSGRQYASTQRDSKRTVSVCKNTEPYYDNGTFLGAFPCPMENDPDDFGYCCGDENLEYCCRRKDTLQFKVLVGTVVAVVLGGIIFVIILIVMCIKKKKSSVERRESGKIKMSQLGIPFFSLKTRNVTARQSDDGYHVLVEFRNKKYFQEFREHLHQKYAEISWRVVESEQGVRSEEGKVTQEDGGWVTVVLSGDMEDGRPIMVVSRQAAAVHWMEGPFQQILDSMPQEVGCCCCVTHKKTHPNSTTPEPAPSTTNPKVDQAEEPEDHSSEPDPNGSNHM